MAMAEKEPEEGSKMACQVLDLRALNSRELFQSKTLKLEGGLVGYPVLLLVDSGASQNFVARELVDSLGLEVSVTKEFGVNLNNGSRCVSQGICTVLGVKIGKYSAMIDAFVLDLGGVDLILGMEWLETLGETTMDWKRKTISFKEKGRSVTLKQYRIHDNYHTPALQAVLRELNVDNETNPESHDDLLANNEELQQVLQKHDAVFREMRGLPPTALMIML